MNDLDKNDLESENILYEMQFTNSPFPILILEKISNIDDFTLIKKNKSVDDILSDYFDCSIGSKTSEMFIEIDKKPIFEKILATYKEESPIDLEISIKSKNSSRKLYLLFKICKIPPNFIQINIVNLTNYIPEEKKLTEKRNENKNLNSKLESETKINNKLDFEINVEKIKASGEIYKTFLNTYNDPILIFDIEGKVLMINPSGTKPLGGKPKDWIGKSIFDIFPKERADFLLKRLKSISESGETINIEDEFDLPSGKMWVNVNHTPIKDENGNVYAIQLLSYDITAQKLSEEKLRETMGRYKLLVENIDSHLTLYKIDGTILHMNEKASRNLGLNEQNIIGKNLYELFPTDGLLFKEHAELIVKTGKGLEKEDKITFPDGERWFSSNLRPIRNKEGMIYAIQSISEDITERKKIELSLRESEKQYRQIVDNALAPITYLDLEGKIILINKIGAKNLGRVPINLIGQSIYDILPNIADQVRNRVKIAIETNTTNIYTDLVEIPNKKIWFLTNFQPITDTEGKIIAVQLISLDISEQKEAEEKLKETEKKYSDLVKNANSIILKINPDGKIDYANEFALSFFGYSSSELIGKSVLETIVPKKETSGRNLEHMIIGLLKEPNQYKSGINENIRKNGERIWISWTNKPILDDKENLIGILSIGNDITEEKYAKEKLQESETLLKRTQNIAKIGPWELDLKTNEMILSEELINLYQMDSNKSNIIPLEEILHFIHPDDRIKVTDAIKKIRNEQISTQLEYRFIIPPNKMRIFFSDAMIINNQEGESDKIIGYMQDITEKKHAEESLRQSEEKYHLLVDNFEGTIHRYDYDGKILFMNRKGARDFGKKPEELIGKTLYDLFPEERAEFLIKRHQKIIDSGIDETFEDEIITPKLTLWTFSHIIPLKDLNGKYYGVQLISYDITENKKAMEKLRESEEKFSKAFMVSPTMLGITQVEDGRFLEVNDAFLNGLGFKKEEIIGKTTIELNMFDVETREIVLKEFQKNGYLRNFELTFHRKSGEPRDGLFNIELVIISGVQCFFTMAQDITERKEVDKKLRESEKLLLQSQHIAKIGSFEMDLSNQTMTHSDEVYNIYGLNLKKYERMEANTIINEMIHPDDRERVTKVMQKALSEKKTFPTEFRIVREDGEERIIKTESEFINDDSGTPLKMIGYMMDITEQRKTQAAQKRLNAILELTSDLVSIATPEGNLIYMNEAGKKLIGWGDDDIIIDKKISNIHPDYIFEKITNQSIPIAIKNGIWRGETAILNQNGVEIPVSQVIMSHKSSDGRFEYLSTIMRDVSERKKSQENLSKIGKALEQSLNGIALANMEGKIHYSNPAWAKMHGYEVEELIGKPLSIFHSEEQLKNEVEPFIKNTMEKGSYQNELGHIRKDGSFFPTLHSGSYFTDDSGKPIGLIGIASDISDKKEAEIKLAESEEKFRRISEQSLMGISIIQDNILKYFNQAYIDIIEYTKEEIKNWKPMEYAKVVHPEDAKFVAEQGKKKQIGEDGVTENYQFRIITKTGMIKWLEIHSRTIQYLKKSANLAVVVDITERKKIEA
ncbi:MAG: PAS domain S-box protein, partial [archaeon]|nr:PAS domain S-box protein [archaeon]